MAILNKEKQAQIDSAIDRLKINTGLSYPKDNLLDFAKKLCIEVYNVDFDALNKGEINGAIKYLANGCGVIYINKKHPAVRNTFTLAHEIGHFLLHPATNKFRVDVVDYSKEESADETEANYFAASLLVPKDQLEKVLKETGNDLDATANYFGVSHAVIENRIKWIATNC